MTTDPNGGDAMTLATMARRVLAVARFAGDSLKICGVAITRNAVVATNGHILAAVYSSPPPGAGPYRVTLSRRMARVLRRWFGARPGGVSLQGDGLRATSEGPGEIAGTPLTTTLDVPERNALPDYPEWAQTIQALQPIDGEVVAGVMVDPYYLAEAARLAMTLHTHMVFVRIADRRDESLDQARPPALELFFEVAVEHSIIDGAKSDAVGHVAIMGMRGYPERMGAAEMVDRVRCGVAAERADEMERRMMPQARR